MSSKRWKQRPPGSTWGDWGEDDELGRINLLTEQKVLQGAAEIREGRTFSLSLPLDLPGGSVFNQRRYPPIVVPTEDLAHTPDVFYNVVAREKILPSLNDVWSDDKVTLWPQYSTQWDALAHQGAEFDADADGVPEALYYNGYRAGVDVIGPREDARGDGSGSKSHSAHLGMEHMAVHGVQGRGVLIDLAHHLGDTESQPVGIDTLTDIMNRDGAVVEPGDVVLLHTGFDRHVLRWNGTPPTLPEVNATASYLDAYDPGILDWIADSQLSALVADNIAVEGVGLKREHPPEPHTLLPIHHHCLFRLGVPLGELWYLDQLAAWLREHGRSRFLLTAPPLRMPGLQGSPLTPIATV